MTDRVQKIMSDMRERQHEFFEATAACKGPMYAKHLGEAADAYSAVYFAMVNLGSRAEKSFEYAAMGILTYAVTKYAKEAKLAVNERLVRDFIADMAACTRMMLANVKVSDILE